MAAMGPLTSGKKQNAVRSTDTPDMTEPPQYYDSEPSGQPPQYQQASHKPKARPSNLHGGASAANIAAVLAYPSSSQLQIGMEKRSWRERWREWKAGINDPDVSGGVQVSGPTLNVQGIGVKSWTSITPSGSRRSK